jgi:hypothetical protein
MSEKDAVIDQVYYMEPNQTVRLTHPSVVIGSVVSNVPVTVNYKEGKITTMHPGYYTLDEDGKFEVVISYLYNLD